MCTPQPFNGPFLKIKKKKVFLLLCTDHTHLGPHLGNGLKIYKKIVMGSLVYFFSFKSSSVI